MLLTDFEIGLVRILKAEDSHQDPVYICHIQSELDIIRATHKVRMICAEKQMPNIELTRLVIALNELCSNAIRYAGGGVLAVWLTLGLEQVIIKARIADEGSGISDLEWAFNEKTSSGGSLGLGLSGTKRLVNYLEVKTPIESIGYGTLIMIQMAWEAR